MRRAVKGTLLGGGLLIALVVSPPPSTHAQESITIEGQLENGTSGAEVPPEQIVTLSVFNLGDNPETRESAADADGRFSFEGVPGDEGYGYIISTEYAGAVYTYESDYPLTTEAVGLTIYESTNSGGAIEVRSHTLVVNNADPDTQLMNALELIALENTGDRTFVPDITQPGIMDLLRFSLPSTAVDLDVLTSMRGGQILQVDRGFAITTPVPPGAYEIAYTFRTSYWDGKLSFDHALPFGADTFRVLLLHDLGQVTGGGLQEMERLILGEQGYQRIEGEALDAGARIELDFTGLPQPSLWQHWQDIVSSEGFLGAVIPGTLGMGLLALLAYVLYRKGSLLSKAEQTSGPDQHPAIIETIARLDGRFQQGEIGKQEYLQLRGELKGQILDQPVTPSPSLSQPATASLASETGEPSPDQVAEETERPGL